MATSIRLPVEVETRLDELAAKTGRTKSFYLREAIETHLGDLEDYYAAQDVLSRVRAGTERTLSLDEVEKHLGLAD
jgi:RHH-type rel operon transcriptional repressor/antitoxin RelB